jgi:hypothetical protein
MEVPMEQEQMGGESFDSTSAASSSSSNGGNPSAEGMAAIEAKFAEVYGDGDGAAQVDEQARVDGENADADALAAEAVEGEGEKVEGGDKPKAPTAKPAVKPASATAAATSLSPLHRKAAALNGWDSADIDAFYKADPAAAERMFERLHTQTLDQYRQLAASGQQVLNGNTTAAAPAQGNTPAAAAPAATTQAPANALEALFTDKALAEFAENNGEELVEKFLKPFRAQVYEPVMQMRQWYEAQQRDALKTQVEATFKGFEGDFGDIYGKGRDITPQQLDARSKVAMLADALAVGADKQGRSMSVQDALEAAHTLFTADKRAEIERRAILGKVQKRSASITSRPTQRREPRTVADGAGKSDQSAIEAYTALAAERGIEV